MVRRTGLTTIRATAYRLCQLVGAFEPIIRAVYPDSIALHGALSAVSIACSELVLEADNTLPDGT